MSGNRPAVSVRAALLVVPVLFLFSASVWADASSAVREMARIVAGINHHVTEADRNVLRRIVGDEGATRGERVIADALLQFDHRVTAADRERLEALTEDSSATGEEQVLADIVARLNHQASGKDKERLRDL